MEVLPHGRKPGKSRPKRPYRNPVFLAREWEKMLRSGKYVSQSALARKLGVSRVRVTQVLNLLRLTPEALEKVAGLGDPLTSPIVTERKLRPLIALPGAKQRRRVANMVRIPLKKYAPVLSTKTANYGRR